MITKNYLLREFNQLAKNMTEEKPNLFRVFLVGANELHIRYVGAFLARNRCEVLIYENALDIPKGALTDENISPHAILAPNMKIHSLKKNAVFAELLLLGRPLIALCDTMHADKETVSLDLPDKTEISYTKVKQLAAPAILKLLCEMYGVETDELPMSKQRG